MVRDLARDIHTDPPKLHEIRHRSMRKLAAKHGRGPRHLKILAATAPVPGATGAEARLRHQEMLRYASPEGAFALFGGWTGIDLSTYGPNDKLADVKSEGMQFLAQYCTCVDSTGQWTMSPIAEFLSLASLIRRRSAATGASPTSSSAESSRAASTAST